MKKTLLASALLLAFVGFAFAQTPAPAQKKEPVKKEAKKETAKKDATKKSTHHHKAKSATKQ